MLQTSQFNLDTELFLDLNGHWGSSEIWDQFFYGVSGKLIWAPLYILILFIIYRKKGWKTMLASLLFVVLCVALSDQICNFFKSGLEKLRPTHNPHIQHLVHTVNGYRGGQYGTFSAHAATTASIATFTALVIRKKRFTIPIFFWVLMVSYSRIYLGVHFPADIMFGASTGVLVGIIVYRIFLWHRIRKFYHTVPA